MACSYLKTFSKILPNLNESAFFVKQNNLSFNQFICLGSKKSYICTSALNLNREDPISKTYRILKDDLKPIKHFLMGKKYEKPPIFPSHCDIVIVGGGVMGFSVAYWLKQRALEGLRIVVVEKEPMVNSNSIDSLEYLKSTTCLSVGGIRQQFSLKENIELSLYSANFLRNIKHYLGIKGQDPPDINFNPAGYLFLAPEQSAQVLEDNVNLQSSLGAKVELLSPDSLKSKFPWLNVEGVALASHGLENEGWFDPWMLLHLFKRKSLSLGVELVNGEVTEFKFHQIQEGPEIDTKNLVVTLPDGTEKNITFSQCIIAAGAMSGHLGKLFGMGSSKGAPMVPIPIEPRKRYVHVVHCPNGPGFNTPFLIDYSGAYLRREGFGDHYICGMSPKEEDEPSVDNLDVEGNYFEDNVWPVIAYRVPAFEKCKLKSSWAGFYDYNCFDENAFIGPHPVYGNICLAAGFSGHGIQHAPAIGRAIMELIIDGKFQTIDLSRFSFDRYIDNDPLWESNIV